MSIHNRENESPGEAVTRQIVALNARLRVAQEDAARHQKRADDMAFELDQSARIMETLRAQLRFLRYQRDLYREAALGKEVAA